MDETIAPRRPSQAAAEAVEGALADVERALHEFQDAYVAWSQATHLDVAIRKGLLAQAETRLRAAQEALMALEQELALLREEPGGA